MIKHGIDQQALIKQFSEATAQQGEALRKAVNDATLKALQGRELTLANIKQVLSTVAKAASAGAAASPMVAVDVEALLRKAFAGMDSALEQAVQANRKALQQMVDQGANLRETQLKKALADIEKMEDALFDAVRKAAAGTGGATGPGATLQGPWAKVLRGCKARPRTPAPWPAPPSSSCWTTPSRACATAGHWACKHHRPCWIAIRRWSAGCSSACPTR